MSVGSLQCLKAALLRGFEAAKQPIRHRFESTHEIALGGFRIEFDGGDAFHFGLIVVAGRIQLGAQIVNQIGISDVFQGGC